jgi:2-dehydropantoate 2-reductase
MRHAVLGAGGIGGLLAAALARAGGDVVLLMRCESISRYPGRLHVASVVLGDFEVEVSASSALGHEVDVLWVATKATQLERALVLAPPDTVGNATVVPLLNGVDRMTLLLPAPIGDPCACTRRRRPGCRARCRRTRVRGRSH